MKPMSGALHDDARLLTIGIQQLLLALSIQGKEKAIRPVLKLFPRPRLCGIMIHESSIAVSTYSH